MFDWPIWARKPEVGRITPTLSGAIWAKPRLIDDALTIAAEVPDKKTRRLMVVLRADMRASLRSIPLYRWGLCIQRVRVRQLPAGLDGIVVLDNNLVNWFSG